jgi:hypothetical protein
MFEVEYDEHANCIEIIVNGFWNRQTVSAFADTFLTRACAAKAIRTDFDVLVESLQFPVQANDVADLLTEVMRTGMTQTTGRAAVVVGSQLNKLQAMRTLTHPRVRIFLDLHEARNWLIA